MTEEQIRDLVERYQKALNMVDYWHNNGGGFFFTVACQKNAMAWAKTAADIHWQIDRELDKLSGWSGFAHVAEFIAWVREQIG